MVGLAFFDGATVVPVLLDRLGASPVTIGLIRLLQTLGYTLPALFAAHYIHGRARHKAYLLWTCAISRAGLLTLPPVILFWATSRPGLALAWFLVVVGVFWLADGACAVSWLDIIGKTIPERVRGRFFGTMQTASGLGAIVAGAAVAQILRSAGLPFPLNFAVLAAAWCAGAWVSQIALAMIREPEGVSDDVERPTLPAYLRQAMPLLRRHPRVAHLIITRIVLDGAGMAAPFYVLYAQRDLHVSLVAIGQYIIVLNVGRVCSGPVWGWITDRFGAAAGLRAVAFAVALIPVSALLSSRGMPALLPVAFFLMGAVQDGLWMVASTALLESVGERDRPLAVGVASVFQTPSAVYGIVGGALLEATSFPVVFAVALGCGLAGCLLALRMPARPDLSTSA